MIETLVPRAASALPSSGASWDHLGVVAAVVATTTGVVGLVVKLWWAARTNRWLPERGELREICDHVHLAAIEADERPLDEEAAIRLQLLPLARRTLMLADRVPAPLGERLQVLEACTRELYRCAASIPQGVSAHWPSGVPTVDPAVLQSVHEQGRARAALVSALTAARSTAREVLGE